MESYGDVLRKIIHSINDMKNVYHDCKVCGCPNTEEEIFINRNQCFNCGSKFNLKKSLDNPE